MNEPLNVIRRVRQEQVGVGPSICLVSALAPARPVASLPVAAAASWCDQERKKKYVQCVCVWLHLLLWFL